MGLSTHVISVRYQESAGLPGQLRQSTAGLRALGLYRRGFYAVNILASSDGTNFYNVSYALVATPSTNVVAAITITTAVTTTYLIEAFKSWRFLKLALSANTNCTLTASAWSR